MVVQVVQELYMQIQLASLNCLLGISTWNQCCLRKGSIWTQCLLMIMHPPILNTVILVFQGAILLPFNCELNNLGSLWFIWRIPSDFAKQDTYKAKAVMDNREKGIQIYHTREMRRQFCNRYHILLRPVKLF